MMTLKDKADFSNFKPRPFNMREFYDRTGHDIKEMLLSCYYRGVECSAEDFSVVSLIAIFVSGTKGRHPIGGDFNCAYVLSRYKTLLSTFLSKVDFRSCVEFLQLY